MKHINLRQMGFLFGVGFVLNFASVNMAFAEKTDPATFQAALSACGQNAPVDWRSMDESARKTLHSCLKEHGVADHHHHRKFFKAIAACAAQKGTALPKFEPGGEKPELTDVQKAVLKECKAEVVSNFKASKAQSTN